MNNFVNRIVAVINKNLSSGKAANALGHLALAMGAINHCEVFSLVDYYDKAGNKYPNISKMPFIVLKATSNKIRILRDQAIQHKIQQICFTDAMTEGTWQEQLENSQNKSPDELGYYGILLFGDSQKITELTKKFSLY